MKHYRIILLSLLILICLMTLASIFKPEYLLSTKFASVLESESLNSILLLADIAITISLFLLQDSDSKKSTHMEFRNSTAPFNPGIDSYITVSPWVYQLIQPSNYTPGQPYYYIQAYQEPFAKHALLIPMEATVRTKTDGTNVVLSDLEVGCFDDDGNVELLPLPESFPNIFLSIEKIYQSGSKFFVCFSLMLDENKNTYMKNRVIVIRFFELFTNIYGQNIKRRVQLKILNSTEYGLLFQGQS